MNAAQSGADAKHSRRKRAAAAAASTGQHNTTLLQNSSRVRPLALLCLPSGTLM
jgi:hypothetical protein